jgi:shikimate dehydrogenase
MTSEILRPIIAGLIGWPVFQSKSPIIHRHWLKTLRIDGDYIRFPVAPGGAKAALTAMGSLGITGLQATMPHKRDCYEAVDLLSDAARALGVVNTVRVMPDGRLFGHNSDMEGFITPLASIDLAGKTVTVLGAGGAAAALVAGLASKNPAKLHIVNRSSGAIARLLYHLGPLLKNVEVAAHDWAGLDACLAESALVANGTSLGMTGEPPLAINLERLDPTAIVYDIVTHPCDTKLLIQARARGLGCFDGFDMLIGQARSAFALFYGVAAPDNDDQILRELLNR